MALQAFQPVNYPVVPLLGLPDVFTIPTGLVVTQGFHLPHQPSEPIEHAPERQQCRQAEGDQTQEGRHYCGVVDGHFRLRLRAYSLS